MLEEGGREKDRNPSGLTASGGAARREIKFRVWDGAKMHDNALLEIIGSEVKAFPHQGMFGERIQGAQVMQWTGLKDKNGRDIYEGDIIRSNRHSHDRFTVEFVEGGFCAAHPGLAGYPTDLNHFYPSVGCMIEVVGNIYEAPPARSAPRPSAGEGSPPSSSPVTPTLPHPGATP